MNLELENELRDVIKKLNKLPKPVSKRSRRATLRKGAKIMIAAAKSKIKESKEPHKRYRADGTVAAVYFPGNLKASIGEIKGLKSKDIFIGPRVSKRFQGSGVFGPQNPDGYYAHFVEFGTIKKGPRSYMRSSYREQSYNVLGVLVKDFEKKLKREIIKQGIK